MTSTAIAILPSTKPIAVAASTHEARADTNAKLRPERPKPVLIIAGKDDADRPHASAFGETVAVQAREAAQLMGMSAIDIGDDELLQIATQLPEGKLFASGKAFVPFVKASLFDRLLPYLPARWMEDRTKPRRQDGDEGRNSSAADAVDGSSETAAATGKDPRLAATYPEDWSGVGLGSIVLARESKGEPWYEATVVEVRAEGFYTLKWRDFIDMPKFARRREGIALMHPLVDKS